MPLNPEEVVNKRFSATKFRQGYDEEEVDEFLDEVVTELRRLNAESTELRSQLSTCQGHVAELTGRLESGPDGSAGTSSGTVSGTSSDPVAAGSARPEQVTRAVPTTSAEAEAPAAAAPATAEPVTAEPAPGVPAPVAATVGAAQANSAPSRDAEGAAGMLALAQRLHDEHVAAGRSKGDKLVSEAQERATRLVQEAETTSRETLGALETKRKALETQVEELRSFEREYRSRLKTYLESQLRELETSGGTTAGKDTVTSPAAGSDGTAPRFPFSG